MSYETDLDAAVENCRKTMDTIENGVELSYEAKCLMTQLNNMSVLLLGVMRQVAKIEERLAPERWEGGLR